MANPLFNPMNGGQNPQGEQPNMMNAFQQFMQQNKGKNPNELLNQLLNSGQINQSQLNQAQAMYQKMGGMFNGMKSMFGFK